MLVVEGFFSTHAVRESWCRPRTANIAEGSCPDQSQPAKLHLILLHKHV